MGCSTLDVASVVCSCFVLISAISTVAMVYIFGIRLFCVFVCLCVYLSFVKLPGKTERIFDDLIRYWKTTDGLSLLRSVQIYYIFINVSILFCFVLFKKFDVFFCVFISKNFQICLVIQ